MKVMCEAKKSRPGETGRYNTATIADFNGNISLKNISPRREGEIKNLSQQREEISRASDGGANVVPSSTNSDSYVGGAPVSAGRSSDGANIAQESQNVNDENDHATTRKSPMEPAGTNPSTELHHLGDSARNIAQEVRNVNEGNVLAYDISGIRKSTGRGLDGSAISADALDQSIDNSSIPNNPQDVNTDNRYQHPLQETINEMEANPKPRMTRELREAIDEFIYENIDQNLFNNNAIVLELSVEMAGNRMLLEEEHVHITVE